MQRERPVSEKPKKRKPYGKGLPANYQGATPEEVALAVLRYRPGKKKQAGSPTSKKEEDHERHERAGSRRSS